MRKKLTAVVLAVAMVMSMALPVYASEILYTPYTDVSEDEWYYDAVCWLYYEGLIPDINEEDGSVSFYPDSVATQEWVTTILYRMSGEPEVAGTSSFTDVVARSWYVDAVIWAEQNGISYGNSDGTYGIGEAVTCEELAEYLYRYSECVEGMDISASTDLSAYPDADEVSSSAETELSWAVAEGLIQGVEIDGEICLAPSNEIPRAGVAVVFCRYMEYLGADIAFDDPGYDYIYVDEDDMYVDEEDTDSEPEDSTEDLSEEDTDNAGLDSATDTEAGEESGSDAEEESGSSLSYYDFTDLDDSSSWYYEGVSYVIKNSIMNGTSSDTFNPDGTCTRSMIVTILYRLAGSPPVEGVSTFDDVEEDQWYTDAIIWAEQEEITTGVSSTLFNVNGTLTREQFATFMYRYAQYMGQDTSVSGNLSSFSDYYDVSSWAEEAMSWAVDKELITGSVKNGEIVLAPTDSCTRSMAAVIIYRFSV